MNAAVHLGKDYEEILHSIINTRGKKVRKLFEVSQLLIEEQETSVEYQRLVVKHMGTGNPAERQTSPTVDSEGLCLV